MILLDVNVLVAAHRRDHPHHDAVRPWFDALTGGVEQFGVPDAVWASFVRIATNRRIFDIPTPIADTFDFLRAVRSQPNHVLVVPSEEHLALFEELCRQFDAVGDLAADAYVASLAMELGCTLASLDRDFARFADLDWAIPGETAR